MPKMDQTTRGVASTPIVRRRKRTYELNETTAEALRAALRSGQTLSQITRGEIAHEYVPGTVICRPKAFTLYCETYPDIADLAESYLAANKLAAIRARKIARKKFCFRGHEYTPENTRIRRDGRRQCRTCKRLAQREFELRAKMPREKIERILTALDEGKGISFIAGKGPDGKSYVRGQKICSWLELRSLIKNNPALGKRIQKKLDLNRKSGFIASGNTRRIVAAPAVMRNNGLDLFAAITRATATLPPMIRDDVMGAMFIAASEGRLKLSEVSARVCDFVRMQNRDDRQSVFNPWGHLSLNKPLNDDSDATLMDVIREDQRLWG